KHSGRGVPRERYRFPFALEYKRSLPARLFVAWSPSVPPAISLLTRDWIENLDFIRISRGHRGAPFFGGRPPTSWAIKTGGSSQMSSRCNCKFRPCFRDLAGQIGVVF